MDANPTRSRLPALLRRLLWLTCVGLLGFVGGAFTLFVIVLRSGPPHEIWHEVQLDEEFTAARAGEVRTLDDYLALEDRLFAELEREVFDRVGTGPEFAFVRYSRGSRSDPGQGERDWNRTFELRPEATIGGVLLLHGMSDSPYSMRAAAEVLRAVGYHVLVLRMPGHGTAPAALKDVEVEDLVAAVRIGMTGLQARVGDLPLHVVGYSTGAALAVRHCLDVMGGADGAMPRSLVLISPAIGLTPAAAFAGFVQSLSVLPGLERAAWTDLLQEFDPYKYESFPVNAGRLVYELTASNAKRLAVRSNSGPVLGFPPTLVFLSAVDATISADAVVDNLLEHLEAGQNELVLFDVNRAQIAASLLVDDPGPLTRRMIEDEDLAFAVTLITNRDPDTMEVVAHRKLARSAAATTEELDLAWPRSLLSLSHVALPFRDDDPVYGGESAKGSSQVRLGQPSIQGERGSLRIPADALLRVRHNPFFDVIEGRMIDWINAANR